MNGFIEVDHRGRARVQRLTWCQRDMRRMARWFGLRTAELIRNRRLYASGSPLQAAEVAEHTYLSARAAASLAFTAHPELRGVR